MAGHDFSYLLDTILKDLPGAGSINLPFQHNQTVMASEARLDHYDMVREAVTIGGWQALINLYAQSMVQLCYGASQSSAPIDLHASVGIKAIWSKSFVSPAK